MATTTRSTHFKSIKEIPSRGEMTVQKLGTLSINSPGINKSLLDFASVSLGVYDFLPVG